MNETDGASTPADNYPNSPRLCSSRRSELIKPVLEVTSLIISSVIAILLISKLLATIPLILAYGIRLVCFALVALMNHLILTWLFGGSLVLGKIISETIARLFEMVILWFASIIG